MPYTNAWSNVIPAGTVLARQIDDHIRQLRLDIAERMVDLVEDWEADPIEPKAIWKGAKEDKTLIIPASTGILDTSANLDVIENGSGLQIGATQFIIPVFLPPGVTVTLVELLANRRVNAFLTWDFYRRSFSGAAEVSMANVIHNIAGVVVSAPAAPLEIVIDPDAYYFVRVAPPGSAADIYAVRVTYDTPDSRNTI